MNISEYKLLSDKIKGEIVFIYHNGILASIVFKLTEPLSLEQVNWFGMNLFMVYVELEHLQMQMGGKLLKRITPVPAKQKLEMFCEYYKRFIKIDYKKQNRDHFYISKYEVNDKLLTTYFKSENVLFKNKHSVGNYTKFFNQLQAEAEGAYNTSGFPDYYSEEFLRTLKTPKQIEAYWAHLRSKGFKYSNGSWTNTSNNNENQKAKREGSQP